MVDWMRQLAEQAYDMFVKEGLGESQVKEGEGGNFVTEADKRMEKFLIDEIAKKFPDDTMIAEESWQGKEKQVTDGWFIDPIDGTTNSVFGLPHYAVSLARMKDGELESGVVFNLVDKSVYWAVKNQGAYRDGKRLKVKERGLKDGLVCAGSPYGRDNFVKVHGLMDKVHRKGSRIVILGCAAEQMGLVAEGKLTLYYEAGLKPWDAAAGTLIIREAGGVVKNWQGGEFEVMKPKTFVGGSRQAVEEFLHLE